MLPFLLLLLFVGPPAAFLLLVIPMQVIGLSEVHGLMRSRGLSVYAAQGYGYAVLLSLLGLCDRVDLFLPTLFLAFFTMFLQRIGQSRDMPMVLPDVGGNLFAVFYMGLLPAYFMLLRSFHHGTIFGACLVTWYLAVIFLGDSGAYFMGRRFGKTPMAPKLSPKKTWEGLVGGVLCSVVIAGALKFSFLPQLPLLHVPFLVLVLQFFGHTGDLFESALKRSCNVKDSGGLFPGHGGALDRLDSVVMAVPAFYYYIVFVLGWPL